MQGLAGPPTGATLRWQRSDADSSAIADEVRPLLADGMTRQTAVRVALLNNPSLQATFEDVGISQADLVQAGLPSNPQLSLFPAFPLATDNSAASLLAFVSDLWMVPARRAVAEAEHEVTLRRVAAGVVQTANEAVKAYDDVLYRTASLEVERTNRDIRSATAARTRKQADDAVEDDLAMLRTEAEALEQELMVAQAEKELASARLRLATVLGLPGGASLPALGDRFEPPDPDGWTRETAVAFALQQRLDVAAAREKLVAAERQVTLERRSVLADVQLGPGYAGGIGNADSGGPSLQMGLPVFDQNQAQVAKADYELRKRKKQLVALEQRVAREIEDVLADIAFYRRHVELYQKRLEPLQAHAVERAEKLGASNDAAVLHALEARQEEVDGRRGFLEAVRRLRAAQQSLQRALWAGSSS